MMVVVMVVVPMMPAMPVVMVMPVPPAMMAAIAMPVTPVMIAIMVAPIVMTAPMIVAPMMIPPVAMVIRLLHDAIAACRDRFQRRDVAAERCGLGASRGETDSERKGDT